MWSVVEKTALAEAEVEYHDHNSTTIWVRFPIVASPRGRRSKAPRSVIWTTTPWTIPANRAIAYGEEIDYAVVRVEEVADGSRARPGDAAGRSRSQLAAVATAAGIAAYGIEASCTGAISRARSPRIRCAGRRLRLRRAAAARRLRHHRGRHRARPHRPQPWRGRFRAGLAPRPRGAGHGGRGRHATPTRSPGFAGLHVFKARGAGHRGAAERGALLARGTLVHSYPHSWRSKAPLIFRATAQWFIPMEAPGELRDEGAGRDRCHPLGPGARPQPHPLDDREPARLVRLPPARLGRADRRVRGNGRRARCCATPRWWSASPRRSRRKVRTPGSTPRPAGLPGRRLRAADYEKVDDILDVWFDMRVAPMPPCSSSGPSCNGRPRSTSRARTSIAAGSSRSLLESCGTRGRAPYDAVLTHGFVVDAEGRKMSKSLGNVVVAAST